MSDEQNLPPCPCCGGEGTDESGGLCPLCEGTGKDPAPTKGQTMRKVFLNLVACLAVLGPIAAFSQSTLLQNGTWTNGHVPVYTNKGNGAPTVSDGGPARGGNVNATLSEMALTATGNGNPPYAGLGTGPLGTNFCDYDGPSTGISYHYLCLSANAQGGGLINYGYAGLASPLPLNFIINGTTYAFPFAVSGIVGPSTSTVGDLACWNNTVGTLLKDCGLSGIGANPTAQIGNSVVNGSATTFMRSDAAPALASGAALGNLAAGSITNSYLANSSMTISGQTCTLGSSCSIPTGSLSAIANNTVIGNVSGGSASPTALTQTQLTSLVNVFNTSNSGAAPSSPGGTTSFLRADGTWQVPAGSSAVASGTIYDLAYYTATGATVGGLATGTADQTLTSGGSAAAPYWATKYNTVTAMCLNAAGDGAIIQTAVNTGKTVFIQGPCVLDSTVTLNTPSQLIYGSGANQTNLNVPTSAVATFGNGVFVVNTGNPGPGPILQDFAVNFAQPDPTCTVITGYISGTTLTAQSVSGGSLAVGNALLIEGYQPWGTITAGSGGAGTYTISNSGTWGSSGSPVTIQVFGSCSRNNLKAYPPAIYAQNQTRLSMFRMKITGAMIGIDGRGNSGGWMIDDLKMSAFEVGIWFDNGGDTNRINNWHSWPYGNPNAGGTYGGTLTQNQIALYSQFNTSCTPQSNSGSAGAISLNSGAGFLQIDNHLTIAGQGWCLFNSSSGFGPIVQASNVSFDTFNGLYMTGGTVNISQAYFTLGDDTYQAVTQNGGLLNISNSYFNQVSPATVYTPIVAFHGGTENGLGTGNTASMTIANSNFDDYLIGYQVLKVDSANGNGNVNFNNNSLITSTSATYASPLIGVTGAGGRVKIENNNIVGSMLGSGTAISVATDNWNTVIGNTAPGWLMAFPASPTLGIYTCNNSSSSIACGGGGGSIPTGTTGQLLAYTGTSTVAGTSTPTVTGISVTSNVNDGGTSCGGNACVWLSGSSTNTSLGNTTHNTYINSNTAVLPYVSNTYNFGGSGNLWATGFFQSLNIAGITGSTQCLHVNSTGTVSGTGTDCGSGSGAVTSVTASGSGISASPTTGAVVISNTGVTSLAAGSNVSVSGSTGGVTVSLSSNPIFSTVSAAGFAATSNVNDGSTACGGSACVWLSGAGTSTTLGNLSKNTFINALAALDPYADNTLTLGGSGNRWTTVYAVAGTINTSDRREKNILSDEVLGLDFVRKLHPVEYSWKDQAHGLDGVFHGLIAQEVAVALDGEPFAGLVKPSDKDERYGLRYDEFIAPLVKGEQQLSALIDTVNAKINVAYLLIVLLALWNFELTLSVRRLRKSKDE